jgi:NADH-quinone oxidoreductase subunit L
VLPTVIAYVTAFYMMRCWMLTFWGKPRNQKLYDHAHEKAIMWGPLAVLAVLAIISGYGIGAQTQIENAMTESVKYCQEIAPGSGFMGQSQAWPVAESVKSSTEEPAAPPDQSESAQAMERGEQLTAPFKSWLFWGFLVGIGGGFLIYRDGYSIARKLHAIKPLGSIHTWLYRRMYFDELYFLFLVSVIRAIAALCAIFDKYVVDGLVNLAACLVRGTSKLAGLVDQYIVDGAVNGAGSLAQELGAAVRTPQSGRVRMYVTVLMIAVALGLAGAIVVVLSQ